MRNALLWLIGIAPAVLFSQSKDTLHDLQVLDPASVSCSIKGIAASGATEQVKIIGAQTIKEMGAQNAAEVLQNQSGILLNQDAQLGTGISLQGLSGQSVKIMINGAPLAGRLNGNIDISQIPTNQIEQIEIIEGPMSVLFGSDAMGGIINIITKQPQTVRTESAARFYLDGRSNTNLDVDVSIPVNQQRSTVQLFAGRHFFGGMDFDTLTRGYDWKPKTKYFGGVGYRLSGNNFRHDIRANHFYENMLDRSNAEYNLITVTGYNNRFFTQRSDVAVQSNGKFSVGNKTINAKFNNSWNGYHRHNTIIKRNLVTGNETPSFIGERDTTRNHLFNARGFFEIEKKLIQRNSLMLGYDANHELLSTGKIREPKSMTDIGLFVQGKCKPNNQWLIQPSLRGNFNSRFGEPILTSTQNLRFTPIIPALQTRYKIGNSMWRMSYAKGYRAPSLKELYFLFVDINHNVRGNEQLKAEVAHNFMASYKYRHSVNRANPYLQGHTHPNSNRRALTFELNTRAFYNRVSQQIQLAMLDQNTQLYQYINIGKIQSKGVNLDIDISHVHRFYAKWITFATLGADWINTRSQLSDTNDWQGFNTLQGKFNLKLNHTKSQSSAQIFCRYSGTTRGFLANGSTYKISPYTLVDFNVNTTISKNSKYPLLLQAGCKNVFNVTQLQGQAGGGIHGGNGMLNISPGRALFLSISFQFP
ncbi:MAG: TonB-dependent receptor [Bacteroidetes bacterium]|nr:TonB-dependent receptor [Bacteroidota bacterium]